MAAVAPLEHAGGAVLMFDFGPTSVGTATTVSPYHAGNPGFTDTTWNTSLGTADVAAGPLLTSDNLSAAAVALNLGRGVVATTTSDLATQPGTSSTLGTALSSDIYGGTTSAARDGIFTSTVPLTLQISGLAAGTYDIYYVGRNTNRGTADNYTQIIFAGVSASAGDFNWGSYSSDTITYGSDAANSNTTTWVEGQNFAKLSATLGTGEVLNLAFTGGGAEANRGFLNSLQIVAVPEPSGLLLAALSGVLLSLPRRRPASSRYITLTR